MLKSKPLLFFTLIFAIVAMFATSDSMAFNDDACYGWNYDESCPPPLKTLTDSATGWTITLDSVNPISGTGLYDWYYTVENSPGSGSAAGLNFVAMLIPDCCTEPKINIDINNSDPFKEVFPVAEGENTLYFGRYIEQGFVVKGTADSVVDWHLIANTDKITSSTIIIKLKKSAITFEMAVPGCTPAVAPEPIPGGLRATAEIKKVVQPAPASLMQSLTTEQAEEPREYAICLKAIKNEVTKCYEQIFYACIDPEGDCNALPDDAYCPFAQLPKESTIKSQYGGEPACDNVIAIPEDAAFGICGDGAPYWDYNPDPNNYVPPTCLGGPNTTNSDGGFFNPCKPATGQYGCIECVFGGYPYCICW